jgi:hypothetical protein
MKVQGFDSVSAVLKSKESMPVLPALVDRPIVLFRTSTKVPPSGAASAELLLPLPPPL